MIVELFDSYGYDSKGGNFICNAVRKGLKYEPETRVSRKRNALCTFLMESGQETNDINQSPLLYKNKIESDEPIPKHDYSKDYLTFEALGDGTFSFNGNTLQYSIDNGKTWETLTGYTATPTITAGSKILWKQTGLTPSIALGIGTFSSTSKFNVSGNAMSLLYGDDFVGQQTLQTYSFQYLFRRCGIVFAKDLVLPATTLAQSCYYSMFYGCTQLTTAPALPATTLADSCYGGMFQGCTSLTMAPELPATTLAQYCYSYMFNNCTSLTTAPKLPATTLAPLCYNYMFFGCTSLTNTPELPATTLAQSCYYSMFYGCTRLTNAPELPATTLAGGCYESMFYGCTSLTTAPELPATTLAGGCYRFMFDNCSSLEYLKILYTGSDSPGSMNNVSSEGDLYLYSQALASNNQFLKGFNGWRLYLNDEYSGIIDIHGGGCGCGGCGC